MEKYCRVRQAADDNMAHAHCMLGSYGYKHTQNMKYLLFFHNNVCTKAPQSYVESTMPVVYLSINVACRPIALHT